MRINQSIRSQVETMQTRKNVEGHQGFNHIVQSQTTQLKQQAIQQLMDEITLQGDKLSRFRSFQDLVKFKRLVKNFLEKTVYDAYELQTSHSFNDEGNSRHLTVIKEIDEKLTELTDVILSEEKKTVNLLEVIGEIEGLLVNLYT